MGSSAGGEDLQSKTRGNDMPRHSERCKQCKNNIATLLGKRFGEVIRNHLLDLPAMLDGYKRYDCYETLGRIHESLQDYRGHHLFAHARRLSPVDFYVPDPGLVVEFDESQHFTEARRVSLAHYPPDVQLGYDRDRWIELCRQLNRHDNDPPHRDEQRAWYDTLRDFSTLLLDTLPTVRLYAMDEQWCALDPEQADDVDAFYAYLTQSCGSGGGRSL